MIYASKLFIQNTTVGRTHAIFLKDTFTYYFTELDHLNIYKGLFNLNPQFLHK